MTNREEAENKYLTFVVGDEIYGLDILHIKEIIGILKITHIPDQPDFVRGVINLRGNVIPVMDARLRFGMEPKPYDARSCTVVIHAREMLVGFIVDTVAEVLEIDPSDVENAKNLGEQNDFVRGLGKVGDDVKILLEAEPLLFGHLNKRKPVEHEVG